MRHKKHEHRQEPNLRTVHWSRGMTKEELRSIVLQRFRNVLEEMPELFSIEEIRKPDGRVRFVLDEQP